MTKQNIEVPDVKVGGVYALINTDKNKIYIGESNNIRSRAKAHINLLKAGKHINKGLQQDYNNGENFDFVVLQVIPGAFNSEKRLCIEDYYIECCRIQKIELYNNNDKNTKESFFILASRNDNTLNDIIKKYRIHENRLLTNTR